MSGRVILSMLVACAAVLTVCVVIKADAASALFGALIASLASGIGACIFEHRRRL